MRPLTFGLVYHFNQNTVPNAFVANRVCYRRLLEVFLSHPKCRFTIHLSGTLLSALQWDSQETIDLLRAGIARGQFEILGSSFSQNILLATDEWDNVQQLRQHRQQLKDILDVEPVGCWNPERCWSQDMARLILDAGYEYTFVETHIFRRAGDQRHQAVIRSTRDRDRQLVLFADDTNTLTVVGKAIRTGSVGELVEHLYNSWLAQNQMREGDFAVIYGQDAEATGLWQFETGEQSLDDVFDKFDALLSTLEKQPWLDIGGLAERARSARPQCTRCAMGESDGTGGAPELVCQEDRCQPRWHRREITVICSQNAYVFAPKGGRLLYWFNLQAGLQLVGNQNALCYFERYRDDHSYVPDFYMGKDIFPELRGKPEISDLAERSYVMRRRCLNDSIALDDMHPVGLYDLVFSDRAIGDRSPEDQHLEGTRPEVADRPFLRFKYDGKLLDVEKTVACLADGLEVTYSIQTHVGARQLRFGVENEMTPDYLTVLDQGKQGVEAQTDGRKINLVNEAQGCAVTIEAIGPQGSSVVSRVRPGFLAWLCDSKMAIDLAQENQPSTHLTLSFRLTHLTGSSRSDSQAFARLLAHRT